MSASNPPQCSGRAEGPLSSITPRRRPQALSPRAYQARLDACRVYDCILAGKTQAEIAETMQKDAGWVSRSVKRIRADFSSVYVRPEARQMIDEHLAGLASLLRQALQTAETTAGMVKISALRLAGELFTKQAEYQRSVGLLPDAEKLNAQDDEGPMISLRDLMQDFPREHLDEMTLAAARRITERRNGTEHARFRFPPSAASVHPSESQAQPRIFGRRRVGN